MNAAAARSPDPAAPWRVAFFGTPQFAVPSLRALSENGYEIALVVSQPDRPVGRGHKLAATPVKQAALALQLPVFQPATLKAPDVIERLRAEQLDLIVVAAYGNILPRSVLDIPVHGCINVHASLLPRYRGAAPIQWAILAGEQETGVSIMLMTEAMDAGPVLLQEAVAIGPEETYGELQARLAEIGARCLLEALAGWRSGRLQPKPQDPRCVSFAPMIRKEHGRIWWTATAAFIVRQVRALHPWPGAFFLWESRTVKVHRARVASTLPPVGLAPGTVVATGESISVQTGDGVVELLELQMEGRRRMSAKEFLAGRSLPAGTVFC